MATTPTPTRTATSADGPPLPRVVITHDFMEMFGGAERVTAEMAAAFPEAPVFALLGRPEVARRMGVEDRFVSVVRPRERVLRHYRLAAPAWGAIADRARLPEADVVLASSYAYAHRLRPPGGAPTVCYCHSPLRFAWSMTDDYGRRHARDRLRRAAFGALVAAARRDDLASSRRVDRYLTQSPFTAGQIKRFYGREAEVIGAPVDARRFSPDPDGRPPGDHYLLVGRLVEPYKKVAMAIEAFRRVGEKLLIAGDGPALPELRRAAPPNVEFLGELRDEPLVEAMRSCRAAVFPSRDDFGLVPVEVMLCGRPVLAYGGGGALYTVAPGVSGELFAEQTPEALAAALRAFEPERYDPAAIRRHAMQWDTEAFRARLVEAVLQAAAA